MAVATSRWHLPPQARPSFRTSPLPGQSEPELSNQLLFNLSCLGKEQMPEGDLHAEAGPNPKLNPRSYAKNEEKGKFLPAASGATD